MKFYKGDIIQNKISTNDLPLEYYWCANLVGVNIDTDVNNYHLWYRPFKNHVKHFFSKVSKTFLRQGNELLR